MRITPLHKRQIEPLTPDTIISFTGALSSDFTLLCQVDECRSMAEFGAPTLDVKYSFSNFSFKVSHARFYSTRLDVA